MCLAPHLLQLCRVQQVVLLRLGSDSLDRRQVPHILALTSSCVIEYLLCLAIKAPHEFFIIYTCVVHFCGDLPKIECYVAFWRFFLHRLSFAHSGRALTIYVLKAFHGLPITWRPAIPGSLWRGHTIWLGQDHTFATHERPTHCFFVIVIETRRRSSAFYLHLRCNVFVHIFWNWWLYLFCIHVTNSPSWWAQAFRVRGSRVYCFQNLRLVIVVIGCCTFTRRFHRDVCDSKWCFRSLILGSDGLGQVHGGSCPYCGLTSRYLPALVWEKFWHL